MFHSANSTGRAASGCTQRVFKHKALWQNVVPLKTLCVRCSLQLWNIHHHHHRHHHQYFTEMHPKNGLSELGLKKGFYLRLTQVVCKTEWLSVLAGRHKRHNAIPVGVFISVTLWWLEFHGDTNYYVFPTLTNFTPRFAQKWRSSSSHRSPGHC